MEPCLELQPERTLLVLGPKFAASLLSGDGEYVPPLSYVEFEKRLREDISGVSPATTESSPLTQCVEDHLLVLQERALLHQWLSDTFSLPQGTAVRQTSLARRILELQKLGALVAYLHPDAICEESMQLPHFNVDEADVWCAGSHGILHPFGTYTEPESLLQCNSKSAVVPVGLTDALRSRLCVFIGFSSADQERHSYFDRFMELIKTHSCHYLPICLHEQSDHSHHQTLHPAALHIHSTLLPQGICHIGETSKIVAQSIDFPPQDNSSCSLSLVLGSKNGLPNITKLVSQCNGVNFVLLSNLQCNGLELHPLSVRVAKESFCQFFSKLLSPQVAPQLIQNGVLCVVFGHGSIVWLNNARIGSNSEELNEDETLKTETRSTPSSPKRRSNSKPIPRWVISKQKVHSTVKGTGVIVKEEGSLVPPSILHRRLSLPPHLTLPPAQHIKTKSSNSVSVTNRQQLLISKYLFTRKHRESCDPIGNSTLLRKLLQEEPKQFPKPDRREGSPLDIIEKVTFKRRKDLFFEENSDWSSKMEDVLTRKMAKWERLRAKRRQAALEKKEREERHIASSPTDPVDTLRQQLATPLTYHPAVTSPLPLASSLMSSVNPFLLPPTSTLPLAGTPLVYPTPLISGYPFLSPLPFVQLPQTTLPSSNVYLAPAVASQTASSTNVTQKLRYDETQKLHAVSYTSPLAPSHSTVVTSPPVKVGEKRSRHSHVSPASSSNTSYISTLLQKTPPPNPKKRKTTSTTTYMDDRSDGEEERSRSPVSQQEELLWQFLLDLLLSNTHSDHIQWNPYVTMEFEIKRPRDVAKLWSSYLHDESMDYSKFKRALKYCCAKTPPVLYSVNRKPYVYRFSHSVLYYINMRYTQQIQSSVVDNKMGKLENTREMSRSHEVLVVD